MEMRCLRTMLSRNHYLSLSSAWTQGRKFSGVLSIYLPTQKDKACIGKTIPAPLITCDFRISLCSESELFFSLGHWWWMDVFLHACHVASVMSDSLQPHGLQPARLLCPWNSPGKNTGVGCHALLQGIFPTQGANSNLSLISPALARKYFYVVYKSFK